MSTAGRLPVEPLDVLSALRVLGATPEEPPHFALRLRDAAGVLWDLRLTQDEVFRYIIRTRRLRMRMSGIDLMHPEYVQICRESCKELVRVYIRDMLPRMSPTKTT